MTKAEIIKDSINPDSDRITTFMLTFPRPILAEFNTHRMLSRNAASSRAIPANKLIARIREEPALPSFWGANQAGMQSFAELGGALRTQAEAEWLALRDTVLQSCDTMANEIGLHKQWANRPLETWMHVTVLATATDWDNFFALRAHPAAHPDFMQLAYRMLHAYLESTPAQRQWGEWHLPFEDQMPEGLDEPTRLKVAVARAARLSYLTFEGDIDVRKDVELHDRLLAHDPKHASPAEHQAKAEPSKPGYWEDLQNVLAQHTDQSLAGRLLQGLGVDLRRDQGNLSGWTQYRKMVPRENVKTADLNVIMGSKPDWIQV